MFPLPVNPGHEFGWRSWPSAALARISRIANADWRRGITMPRLHSPAHWTGNDSECAVPQPGRRFLTAHGMPPRLLGRSASGASAGRSCPKLSRPGRQAISATSKPCFSRPGAAHNPGSRAPPGKVSGPKRPAKRSLLARGSSRPGRGPCHRPPGLPRMSISPGRGPQAQDAAPPAGLGDACRAVRMMCPAAIRRKPALASFVFRNMI